MKRKENSRRKFLLTAIVLGIAGGLGMRSKKRTPKPGDEAVRLITPDGKLVEVPRSQLKQKGSGPVSDTAFDRFKQTDAEHKKRIKGA